TDPTSTSTPMFMHLAFILKSDHGAGSVLHKCFSYVKHILAQPSTLRLPALKLPPQDPTMTPSSTNSNSNSIELVRTLLQEYIIMLELDHDPHFSNFAKLSQKSLVSNEHLFPKIEGLALGRGDGVNGKIFRLLPPETSLTALTNFPTKQESSAEPPVLSRRVRFPTSSNTSQRHSDDDSFHLPLFDWATLSPIDKNMVPGNVKEEEYHQPRDAVYDESELTLEERYKEAYEWMKI
ncbi:hypothetical protein DXG01_006066, partial [Tephrocybe rancida]